METSWVSTFLKGYTGIRLKVKYEMTEKSGGDNFRKRNDFFLLYVGGIHIIIGLERWAGWSFWVISGFRFVVGVRKKEGLKA